MFLCKLDALAVRERQVRLYHWLCVRLLLYRKNELCAAVFLPLLSVGIKGFCGRDRLQTSKRGDSIPQANSVYTGRAFLTLNSPCPSGRIPSVSLSPSTNPLITSDISCVTSNNTYGCLSFCFPSNWKVMRTTWGCANDINMITFLISGWTIPFEFTHIRSVIDWK